MLTRPAQSRITGGMTGTTTTSGQSATQILLVRHGHVENPEDVLYGRLPGFRLSDRGVEQARCAAVFLGSVRLAALFSSPLLRCCQTAREILRLQPQLSLRLSRRIIEVRSAYEGCPARIIDRRRGDIYTGIPEGFEQPGDIVRRTKRFLRSIRRRYPGGTVAAVTHGDVIAFTVLWAQGFALTPANKLRLAQAGIADGYPAHASVTRLAYLTDSPDERPRVCYMPLPARDSVVTG